MVVDKYSLISFAPSLMIVGACIVLSFVGVRMIKKAMVRDAEKAKNDQ